MYAQNNLWRPFSVVKKYQRLDRASQRLKMKIFYHAHNRRIDVRSIDFDIAIKPNTQAVRDAVTAELEDLFLREAEVAGSYKQVGEQNDGRIPLSKINEAISAAQGEEDHVLNSPSAEIDPLTGDLLTVGTITFSTLS